MSARSQRSIIIELLDELCSSQSEVFERGYATLAPRDLMNKLQNINHVTNITFEEAFPLVDAGDIATVSATLKEARLLKGAIDLGSTFHPGKFCDDELDDIAEESPLSWLRFLGIVVMYDGRGGQAGIRLLSDLFLCGSGSLKALSTVCGFALEAIIIMVERHGCESRGVGDIYSPNSVVCAMVQAAAEAQEVQAASSLKILQTTRDTMLKAVSDIHYHGIVRPTLHALSALASDNLEISVAQFMELFLLGPQCGGELLFFLPVQKREDALMKLSLTNTIKQDFARGSTEPRLRHLALLLSVVRAAVRDGNGDFLSLSLSIWCHSHEAFKLQVFMGPGVQTLPCPESIFILRYMLAQWLEVMLSVGENARVRTQFSDVVSWARQIVKLCKENRDCAPALLSAVDSLEKALGRCTASTCSVSVRNKRSREDYESFRSSCSKSLNRSSALLLRVSCGSEDLVKLHGLRFIKEQDLLTACPDILPNFGVIVDEPQVGRAIVATFFTLSSQRKDCDIIWLWFKFLSRAKVP